MDNQFSLLKQPEPKESNDQSKNPIKSILKKYGQFQQSLHQLPEPKKKLKIQQDQSKPQKSQQRQYDQEKQEKKEKKEKIEQYEPEEDSYDIFDENKQEKQEIVTTNNKKQVEFKQEEVKDLDLDLLADFDRRWNSRKDQDRNRTRYKTGKFTEEEIKLVFQSLLNFAKKNQLTNEELYKLCADKGKKDFHKAWTEIAKVLPERSVQSIHNLVHRKFNPDNNQGAWTPEEEQQLLDLVNQHGRKWYQISKIMKRTPLNVRDKYKTMGEENSVFRDAEKWNLGEVLGLLLYIQRYADKKILKDYWLQILNERLGENWADIDVKEKIFKHRPGKRRSFVVCEQEDHTLNTFIRIMNQNQVNQLEMKNIPWTKISKKIKTKSKDDIRNFWYSTLSLWFLQPRNFELSKEDENRLIRDIIEQNVEDDDEINFENVLPNSNLSIEDKQTQWHFIKKRVSIRRQLNLPQILEILKNQIKSQVDFTINMTLRSNPTNTQNSQSQILDQSKSLYANKKTNLFNMLLEKYQEEKEDDLPNFDDM